MGKGWKVENTVIIYNLIARKMMRNDINTGLRMLSYGNQGDRNLKCLYDNF